MRGRTIHPDNSYAGIENTPRNYRDVSPADLRIPTSYALQSTERSCDITTQSRAKQQRQTQELQNEKSLRVILLQTWPGSRGMPG